ncbi:uncharacterized protein [Triticum aestivum]|uniref:uncharacterized protein isoform X2 n=1 Tax=Triticum aestivum TaxID=4565 RepID=UPI001D03128F|nr:uncharacterized protein LOC123085315 isoform X2 [Triticum aestivum]
MPSRLLRRHQGSSDAIKSEEDEAQPWRVARGSRTANPCLLSSTCWGLRAAYMKKQEQSKCRIPWVVVVPVGSLVLWSVCKIVYAFLAAWTVSKVDHRQAKVLCGYLHDQGRNLYLKYALGILQVSMRTTRVT